MLTQGQQEAVEAFVARVRSDYAGRVVEVRLLAVPPEAGEGDPADVGLLLASALRRADSGVTDHALDNLCCELSLVHDVLIHVQVVHADEARESSAWSEPASRCLYPA